MGIYVNPGNSAFQRINNSEYVDKTKLIDLMNARIGTNNNLVCISRPRRFGKSFAAQTLSAYYDCSCDSHALFDDKKIAKCASYTEHLNQYNVICFDVTSFISVARRTQRPLSDVPNMITEALKKELIAKINKKAVSRVKVKLYNEVLIVDISVKAPRKNPYYVLSYTYHDVYAMPLELT